MTNPLTTSTSSRPDVTPAQRIGLLVSGVPIAASMLRAFGVYDVTPEQLVALNDAVQWGSIAAGALFLSDAGLRAGRSLAQGRVDAAAIAPAPGETTPMLGALEPLGAPTPPPGHRIVTTIEATGSGAGIDLPTAGEAQAMRPVDAGAEAVAPEDLPTDDEEAAAPPPDDDSATPVDPDADSLGTDPAGAPPS